MPGATPARADRAAHEPLPQPARWVHRWAATCARWLVALAALGVAGCGGGGGGGGGGVGPIGIPSSESDPTPTLVASAEQASLKGYVGLNEGLGAELTVPIRGNGIDALAIGAPPGVTLPSWLKVTVTEGYDAFIVFLRAEELAALPRGTYRTVLRLVGLRNDTSFLPKALGLAGWTPLTYRDLDVRLDIHERLTVRFSGSLGNYDLGPIGFQPAPDTLDIGGDALEWEIQPVSPYVKFEPARGTGPASVKISVDARGLGVGSSLFPLTVRTADGQTWSGLGGYWVFPQALRFTSAAAAPIIGTQFAFDLGQSPAPQTIRVASSNGLPVPWQASPTVPWLTVDRASGVTPDAFVLSVVPGLVPTDTERADGFVRFTAQLDGLRYDFDFGVSSYLRVPKLHLSQTIDVGLSDGLRIAYPTSTLWADWSGAPLPWQVTRKPDWLTVMPPAGTLGPYSEDLTFAVDRSRVPAGFTNSDIEISATLGSYVARIVAPVTVALSGYAQRVSENGVALTSTPQGRHLRRDLKVRDNVGMAQRFFASSDQPWLSAGPVPGDATSMRLTADPTGLAVDTLHAATVTIHAPPGSTASPDTVRVNLWVGSSYPATARTIAGSFKRVKADPLRPWAYVHDGRSVLAYHLYTGALMGRADNVGANLSTMSVAHDGSRLFIVEEGEPTTVKVLALPGLGSGGPPYATSAWPNPLGYDRLVQYVRTSRTEMLMTEGGDIPLSTQAVRSNMSGSIVSLSPVTNRLYAFDFWGPGEPMLVRGSVGLDATWEQEGPRSLAGVWAKDFTNGEDLASAVDDSSVFVTGLAGACVRVDPSSLAVAGTLLGGSGNANNIEVGRDGRLYCGSNSPGSTDDTWIYGPQGAPLGSLRIAPATQAVLARQMAVSGDGLMLAAVTTDGALRIVPTAPYGGAIGVSAAITKAVADRTPGTTLVEPGSIRAAIRASTPRPSTPP
jgi:hypothetical protein